MKIQVYMIDGRVFEYDVRDGAKAREHAHEIIQHGYRHNDGKEFEHYPPHQIKKVKIAEPIDTKYKDEVSGT